MIYHKKISRKATDIFPTDVGGVISGSLHSLDTENLSASHFAPNMLFHKGAVYAVLRKQNDSTHLSEPVVLKLFDKELEVGETGIKALGSDYHNYPSLGISDDDKIIVYNNEDHNRPNINVMIPSSSNSITDYSKSLDPINSPSWNKLAYINYHRFSENNHVMFLRYIESNVSFADFILFRSVDGKTWDNGRKFSDCLLSDAYGIAPPNEDVRHYMPCFEQDGNGNIHIILARRYDLGGSNNFNDLGNINYNRWWYLTSSDGNIFYNIDKSYSHNIDANGELTEEVLNDHYLLYKDPVADRSIWHPRMSVSRSGTPIVYTVVNDSLYTSDNKYKFFDYHNGSWRMRSCPFRFTYCISYDDVNWHIIMRRDVNGKFVTSLYFTRDFVNYTFKRDLISDEIISYGPVTIPHNIYSMPFKSDILMLSGHPSGGIQQMRDYTWKIIKVR